MRGLAIALCAVAACGGSSAGTDAAVIDGSPADADLRDAHPADAAPFSQGLRTIDACKTLGVGTEVCSYTFVYEPVMCAGHGCRRLVIYFAGGQETCPDVNDSTSYLAYYKTRGYVAVCARAWSSPGGSGQFPRHLEAPRFDALVKAITADPDIRAAWSGELLLFSGVSHGASGPVVAMATTAADDASSWKGTAYTGACFYDGTYDAPGLMAFTYAHQCTDAAAIVPYSRAYGRYCSFGAADGNTPSSWPMPSSCSTSDTAADTITAVAPTALAIRDWKLIECGSALAACAGPVTQQDVLPAASVTALCTDIAGATGYTCEAGSFPQTSHIFCGIDSATIGACHAWFDAELTSHGL